MTVKNDELKQTATASLQKLRTDAASGLAESRKAGENEEWLQYLSQQYAKGESNLQTLILDLNQTTGKPPT